MVLAEQQNVRRLTRNRPPARPANGAPEPATLEHHGFVLIGTAPEHTYVDPFSNCSYFEPRLPMVR
jgi:hypothetical protein